MSYADSPAALLVATDCAICGKVLADALSVELAVGPTCRRNLGYTGRGKCELPAPAVAADWGMAHLFAASLLSNPVVAAAFAAEDAHKACNLLVRAIACLQSGPDVASLRAAIHSLGYVNLAEACAKGTGVKVEADGAVLIVRAPFNEAFNAACRTVPGCRWDRETKARTVPVSAKAALWAAIKAAFAPGTLVFGQRVAVV